MTKERIKQLESQLRVCRTSHDSLHGILKEIHDRHRLTGSLGDIPAFVDGVVKECDRLIAAVPELLAACERAEELIAGHLEPGSPTLIQLRAAIAKAKEVS